MMRSVLFAALILSGSAIAKPTAEEKAVKFLKKFYSESWSCSTVDVERLSVPPEPFNIPPSTTMHVALPFKVHGCGMETLVTAPGGPYADDYRLDDFPLRRRVPLELECDALTWTLVDRRTRIVEGCGLKATYLYSSFRSGFGTWVVNLTTTKRQGTLEVVETNEATTE